MLAHLKRLADIELDMAAAPTCSKSSVQSLKCSKTMCMGPKLFDAKCTRLACLLSLSSLFLIKRLKKLKENPTKQVLHLVPFKKFDFGAVISVYFCLKLAKI